MVDMASLGYLISPGERRRLAGRMWRVEALLGRGSEGEVWRVRSNDGDAQAWKRFHLSAADELRREHLSWLVEQPQPSHHFLWPLAITDGNAGLGYLMPLRPAGNAPLGRMLRGVVEIDNSMALECAADIAAAVAALHRSGLVFRDLSAGNVFFNLQTGAVALCDVDNTARDGRSVPRVRGTQGFIAPEVASGAARAGRGSDLYALSTLILCVLTRSKPGASTESQAADWWPEPVRILADRSAGRAVEDPAGRVEALEWKRALTAQRVEVAAPIDP